MLQLYRDRTCFFPRFASFCQDPASTFCFPPVACNFSRSSSRWCLAEPLASWDCPSPLCLSCRRFWRGKVKSLDIYPLPYFELHPWSNDIEIHDMSKWASIVLTEMSVHRPILIVVSVELRCKTTPFECAVLPPLSFSCHFAAYYQKQPAELHESVYEV